MNSLELQQQLDLALQRYQIAGASAAIYYQGELISAAAGLANVRTNIPMDAQTLVHISSITKVINATLIMQLVDENRLTLEDRVVTHLPEFRLRDTEASQAITVKMLLNHTSGIDGELLPDQGHDQEILDNTCERIADLGQVHQPGEDCSYCNTGTVIAGYLAQRITGISWYDMVKEKIFEPLAMEHAIVLPEDALWFKASIGHRLDAVTQTLDCSSVAFLPLGYSPAGATAMMSSKDLITFARAHLSDGVGPNGVRILSAKSAKLMREISVDNTHFKRTKGVGLGWLLFDNGVLGHAGSSAGNVSMLYLHPESDFAAVVLTNSEHGFTLINEVLTPWLHNVANIAPFSVVDNVSHQPRTVANIQRYAGVYESNAVQFIIAACNDGLGFCQTRKFVSSDKNISTTPDPLQTMTPLIPVGEHAFVEFIDQNLPDYHTKIAQEFDFIRFDNNGVAGCLVYKGRIFPRVNTPNRSH